MPKWNLSPGDAPNPITLRLLRTPIGRPTELIITSHRPIGTFTHFYKQRTVPCEHPDPCPPCSEGHSARWHGYLAALQQPHREHVIWEYTSTLHQPILDYLAEYPSLRGALLTAKRLKPHPNSRQAIWVRPPSYDNPPLPDPPDLAKILLHIWGIAADPRATHTQPHPHEPSDALTIPTIPGDGRYR